MGRRRKEKVATLGGYSEKTHKNGQLYRDQRQKCPIMAEYNKSLLSMLSYSDRLGSH